MSRVKLELPSQMEYLGVPDVVLMEIGSELDCCKRSLEELGTSVIEACTNAMEHGNNLDGQTPIEILFDLEATNITVTVLDKGPGFDFNHWQPSSELMRERGRGILIMREFCDSVEFRRHEDGRFMIILTKNLAPADDCD